MATFIYKNSDLYCENVALSSILREVGSPTYIYSKAALKKSYRDFKNALAHINPLIAFSVKANSNLAVLKLLASEGAGADIVSGGELYRALKVGIRPEKIVYSGVGKQAHEMKEALDAGILLFNIESVEELELLSDIARSNNRKAPIAIRLNPDVDPLTHPYISTGMRQSKFGISIHEGIDIYKRALSLPGICIKGIDCHIGSQLTSVSPLIDSTEKLINLAKELKESGVELEYLDIGGGLGIQYGDEDPPTPKEYGYAISSLVQKIDDLDLKIITEPGRVICGNAGGLLTKVLFRKKNGSKKFMVVDAAMNDLIRPALYEAFHRIIPLNKVSEGSKFDAVDIVGPICESTDVIAKDRMMPNMQSDDAMLILSAGAYGFTMSSTYNSRLKAAEVLVDGDSWALIRKRDSYEDLVRGEAIPDFI